MKKLISAILAVVMLLSAITTVSAASFGDVKKSDWFYDSVNYVSDKGIMQGTGKNVFSPNTTLSRAMAVTLLYRIAGTPSVSGVKLPFGDVKSGQWYTDAVKWAYDNGVVKGKSSTVFGTNDNITRAEFVTIIYRYMVSENLTVPVTNRGNYPSDVLEIPSYAFAAVTVFFMGEVVLGRENRKFDPYANISRAEAAAMIERYSQKVTEYVPEDTSYIEAEKIPTTGNLVVKEKKYDYNGAHVMIMNIENQTDKNLTLTITAEFKDSKGNVLKTETRKFEGFPANYRNHIVFQPGIKFDSFTYDIKASSYNGIAYAKYFVYSTKTTASTWAWPTKPGFGNGAYPMGEERASVSFDIRYVNTYNANLHYETDIVFFDNKGEIYFIDWLHSIAYNDGLCGKQRACPFHDILYKDFKLPDEVKGELKVIMALKYVSIEMQE